MRRYTLFAVLFLTAAGGAYFFATRSERRPAPSMPIKVYFTDLNRYSAGTPPFEAAVPRLAPAGASLPEAVLTEFFKGPTAKEEKRGLAAITSGTTGFSRLAIEDGIARVYLTGPCQSGGAVYTVAQPIMKNLLQFAEIEFVKIYDAEGVTEEPAGLTNSIPPCLEP